MGEVNLYIALLWRLNELIYEKCLDWCLPRILFLSTILYLIKEVEETDLNKDTYSVCVSPSHVLPHCTCSVLPDSVTPWTVVCKAPLSMEFSWQEYWSGLSFPSPRYLPEPGTPSGSLAYPALASGFLITSATWCVCVCVCVCVFMYLGKESVCSAGDLGLIPLVPPGVCMSIYICW